MLFELLTRSQALAELTWPAILSKREEFRCLRVLTTHSYLNLRRRR
uniref:Uncharacterized protein n=1 Tax=Arundo donax TaxID=35708 RepID=A0A0A9DW54_ARUDO